MKWFLHVFKNYALFSGRASRTEYWMFVLFSIIFAILAIFIDFIIGTYFVITLLYYLALIIPSIAVCIRRLHDIGKGGEWILISLIPFIGFIWFLILVIKEGNPGENEFGAPPIEI